MAMKVSEVREWLRTLCLADEEVGIDGGGLCLRIVGDEDFYLEVGGIPEMNEEE